MKERLKQAGKRLVFTVIEAVTLAIRLALGAAGFSAVGAAVMLVGFTAEHVVSYNVKNRRPLLRLEGLPFGWILVVAAVETVTWEGWFTALASNGYLAGVILVVGLLVGHGLELNIVNGLWILRDIRLRLKQSLNITGIEAVIGIAWRLLVLGGRGALGFAVLAVGLFVEHTVSAGKRIT